MMWYLQLLVEKVILWSGNDAFVNVVFAALVLWGGFGGPPRVCAVLIAALHLVVGLL